MIKLKYFCCSVLLAITIGFSAHNFLAQPVIATKGVKGYALVIGNDYEGQAKLKTAVNDAKNIAKLLEYRGYVVDIRVNINLLEFDKAVQDFANADNQQNLPMVFYFAGHGIQINGINYLIPNDANFEFVPANIPKNTFSLEIVFERLKKFKNVSKIIILDACRTNPFAEVAPNDWIPGLAAPVNATSNTFVAFSTNPGNIAQDAAGLHSPYTRALIKYLQKPGLTAEELFKKVREGVEENTDGIQTPWENTSLNKNFYFWEPILFGVKITQGDDEITVNVNGEDIATKSSDENVLKKVPLQAGLNDVVIKVYNQRSYTGGILRQPEGWSYTVSFFDHNNQELLRLNDGENRPENNGARHGKTFTAAKFQVLVDEVTGQIKLVNINPKVW